MKKLSWFDRIMAAATFAETNEHDTAKGFLVNSDQASAGEQGNKECNPVPAPDLQGAEAR